MSCGLIEVAVEEIKTLVVRVTAAAYVTEGPLADASRNVTSVLQQRSDSSGTFGQNMHIVAGDRGMSGVLAGKKDQTRWAAYRVTGIMIGETQPLFGHLIESWRLDLFLAIAAQVSVAKIIGHNVYDIGFAGRRMERSEQEERKDKADELFHWTMAFRVSQANCAWFPHG